MENLTNYFSSFVGNISPHGTLAGLIKNKLNEQQKIKRKNYFGVVDICNPLQTYFKLTYPEMFKQSIETKKKFSMGNKQHKITEKKIEKINGFIDKEIILDGELMNIPLKGRADAKVKNSIWEIKSKGEIPKTKEELIEKYPQDLEQVCFYSLLDPENPKENYLIFVNQTYPEEYKAFKIKILDLGKVKNLALSRINKLNSWLDGEDPKQEHSCRYCYEDCSLREELCKFHEKSMLPFEIANAVEIDEASEIESLLKEINLSKEEKEFINYNLFNLITPRRVIHKNNEDLEEEDYDGSEKYLNKQLIQDIFYKLNLGITYEDFIKLEDSKKIKEIYQNKTSFIKFLSNGEEKIFPLLIHISESEYTSSLNKVSDYKRGELGIHCINNKSNKGYLVSFFPKQNNEIRVFEISYNFPKEAIDSLKQVVNILKENNKERIKELPKCPDFIHEKKCIYRSVCPKD